MRAYAGIDKSGQILIRTVTDTIRGAKLNCIVLIGRLAVYDNTSDEMIKAMFILTMKMHGVKIKRVNVELV